MIIDAECVEVSIVDASASTAERSSESAREFFTSSRFRRVLSTIGRVFSVVLITTAILVAVAVAGNAIVLVLDIIWLLLLVNALWGEKEYA